MWLLCIAMPQTHEGALYLSLKLYTNVRHLEGGPDFAN